MTLELNKIYNEDCIGDENKNTGMWRISDKSIDLICADLPYGTTDIWFLFNSESWSVCYVKMT